MSDNNKDVPAQPLVIVRRRRGGEEGHHGGVWKIAYADFMTAMMAFFLVMWLVNAADKKTIVQVAAYFNPMRLTDKTEVTAGLEDQTDQSKSKEKKKKKSYAEKMKEDVEAEQKEEVEKSEKEKGKEKEQKKPASPSPSSEAKAQEEGAMMQEPQKALQKIVEDAKPRQRNRHGSTDGQLRDPFDLKVPSAARQRVAGFDPKSESAKPASVGDADRSADKLSSIAAQPSEKPKAPTSKSDDRKVVSKAEGSQENARIAEAMATEIRKAVSEVPDVDNRNIEVKSVPEGILISLIDSAREGMFEIGSAKPNAETVLILERIAAVVQWKKGAILVRGHTDGRGYKGDMYDNWRLSTARAHMTMQMLLRGGIPQDRFVGVEGRADTDLRNPNNREDAQNRRIDILLKSDVP